MEMLTTLWPPLLVASQTALAIVASAHVVLHKRDVRAAIGWIGLVWLVPFAGPILYGLFGINRIRRRASGLRARRQPARVGGRASACAPGKADGLPARTGHMYPVVRLMDRITDATPLPGNAIVPMEGGKLAYAAMLQAIETARSSVGLVTYIFDHDAAGAAFAAALARAHARGVAVRVLIDGVGARYSRPSIVDALRAGHVPTATFLPSLFPLSIHYANLRNHRKILVTDGRTGFTGGMNIRQGHCEETGPTAVQDVHFELEGPVVAHLAEAFVDDWAFTTGEPLTRDAWFPPLDAAGPVLARGIAAGPDEAFERIRWVILAALSQAKERVRIVTPYFLPDTALATTLQLAALRGVGIDIVIPARSNLRLMQWATGAKLLQFLARGCRIWTTPPPFDHAKLMTVDGLWSLIGSANWDQRSFRLNFEFNVECYDADFAAQIDSLIDRRIASARRLTRACVENRHVALKLRDAAAWLLSPYL